MDSLVEQARLRASIRKKLREGSGEVDRIGDLLTKLADRIEELEDELKIAGMIRND